MPYTVINSRTRKGWNTLEGLLSGTSETGLQALELGCGMMPTHTEGVHTIHTDIINGPHVDMVLDASKRFPFDEGAFDVVFMFGALEHLQYPYTCLEEVHRCLKNGGLFLVSVPHYSYYLYYRELGHIRPGSSRIFDSVTAQADISMGRTTKAQFEILEFTFSMKFGQIFHDIVKRHINFYEDWQLCFKFLPIYDMFFKLRKINK